MKEENRKRSASRIFSYEEIHVGQTGEYTRTISETDIDQFAKVSGDFNPIHMDEDFAKSSFFQGRIAHGMLSVSFISTVLASKLPGPGSVWLSQEISFLKPVRIGDIITAKVEVLKKYDEKRRITMRTTCANQDNQLVIDGKAVVMMLRD